MAINAPVLDMLMQTAKQLPAPRRMLCLGYPDMLVTPAHIEKRCGAEVLARVAWREDSESILRWHGLAGAMDRIAESASLFRAMGIEADFVDIVASRGFEIVLDLNQPAPADMAGRYDIVYDGGTMEHCFNVAQVMLNILDFARVGGFIVHVNPINYYNHGFFNINPTFYHDWYAQAGNEIVSPFYAMHGPVLQSRLLPIDPVKAFAAPERSVMVVVARKARAGRPKWPTQTKYLGNAELKA
jgi:SAM-dependent methyltransferase